jgi:protein tyrosine/serine phosphatase
VNPCNGPGATRAGAVVVSYAHRTMIEPTTPAPAPAPAPPTTPTPARRARRRWVWAIVAAVVIPVAVKEGDVLLGQNFHAVVPGELYRSGQLSASALKSRVEQEGIRTVVNLRGENKGRAWYDDEVRECEALGVRHIDVRISARELPPRDQAQLLLAALHDAPRPILVHCMNGADRSGLACAAYLIAERGEPAERAADEALSLWYGHMPIGATQAMDRFFEMYEAAPRPGPLTLGEWVAKDYHGKD